MVNSNKVVRHNKIKNTGILFEVLTRQLTVDLLNGVEKSKAQEIIEKNFRNDSELGKEHRLYQALMKYKMGEIGKAKSFVNEVISSHKKINKAELRKEKYNLVKELKENYDIDSLFKIRIDDYKLFASIYKIFQAKSDMVETTPEDAIESKYTIIEHITGKSQLKQENPNPNDAEFQKMIENYEQQNSDLRLLSYKVMVDKFNTKYSVLDENQKRLIKEYINNISSANSLMNYIQSEIPIVTKQLKVLSDSMEDKVTKIKISEVINQMNQMKEDSFVDDSHVMVMLNVYELIKELKSLEN